MFAGDILAVPSCKQPALSTENFCFGLIVRLGGGIFSGTIHADAETLVLVTSPQTLSTIAVEASTLSADTVRRAIRESNRQFAEPRG